MKTYFIFFVIIPSIFFSQITKKIDEQIILSVNLFNKGETEKALSLAGDAISNSTKHNYSKGKANGYLNKTNYYYLKRDFSKCIEYIRLIEKEDYFKKNISFQMYVYDLLGQIYVQSNLIDDGMATLRKIVTISERADVDDKYYYKNIAYQNMVAVYTQYRPNNDSLYYFNIKSYNDLNRFSQRNDQHNVLLAKAAVSLSLFYLLKKENDSSEYYKKKSLEYLPKEVPDFSKDQRLYKFISVIHLYNGKYDEAQKYNNLALYRNEEGTSLNEVETNYKIKAEISENLKDSNVVEDLKNYIKVSEKIKSLDQKNISSLIKKTIQHKDIEIEEKKKTSSYLIGLIIIIISISMYGVSHVRRFMKIRDNEKKQILAEKQTEISKLESKINTAFEEVIELAKSNSPNFLTRFKEVYPEFCESLFQRYPDIQNADLTYCAYIKLNFSSKEIANYTFVTHKAILMKRYRLRKKLNLTPEQDLDIWMKNLDNSSKFKL